MNRQFISEKAFRENIIGFLIDEECTKTNSLLKAN